MTVKELKEALAAIPDEIKVLVEDDEFATREVIFEPYSEGEDSIIFSLGEEV